MVRAQDTPAPALDVQALIDDALSHGKTEVDLPPGRYHVSTESIKITGARGFTLSGPQTTLLFSTLTHYAVYATKCDTVSLKGIAIDFDPLSFTQGTITAISPDFRTIDVHIHDGYPRMSAPYRTNWVHIFDGTTREWKRGCPDLYSRVEILSPDTARLHLNKLFPGVETVQVGDFAVLNPRTGGG